MEVEEDTTSSHCAPSEVGLVWTLVQRRAVSWSLRCCQTGYGLTVLLLLLRCRSSSASRCQEPSSRTSSSQ
eukprot:scaffold853_cov386-Prasinococcus_capsulatus_cf.AAC.18